MVSFFFFAQRKNQPVMMQHKDQEFTQTRINQPRHSKHKDTHEGLKFKKSNPKTIAATQWGYRIGKTNLF